jgi:hypothetical protein
MNTDNIVIDTLDKLLQQEEIPADNFKETLQQFKEQFINLLALKNEQLKLKDETIENCRQEIDYLQENLNILSQRPTIGELTSAVDKFQEWLYETHVQTK